MPNLITKLFNFGRSYAKWALAGKPLRDDEYIFELFEICKSCPDDAYIEKTPTRGECDECGCHIKRISAKDDDLNKLAWPTEGCPLGHWKADIDAENESS